MGCILDHMMFFLQCLASCGAWIIRHIHLCFGRVASVKDSRSDSEQQPEPSIPQIKVENKVNHRHPEKELKELREAFRFLDINGDGTVSVYELRTIIHSLGHFPSTDELRQVLKDHNITTGDEFLTFEDFVDTMATFGGFSDKCEHEKEELRLAFKYFDRQGQGFISANDLRNVLECLGEDITEEEVDEMIAEVDINGDGRIDFEEFIACLKVHDDRRCSVLLDLSTTADLSRSKEVKK